MNFHVTFECSGVDWSIVSRTLQRVGMAYYEPDAHRKAFENSHTSVFVYDDEQLVGFGGAIKEGACLGWEHHWEILKGRGGRTPGRGTHDKIWAPRGCFLQT